MTRIVGLPPAGFRAYVVNVYNGEIISIPLVPAYLKKQLSGRRSGKRWLLITPVSNSLK